MLGLSQPRVRDYILSTRSFPLVGFYFYPYMICSEEGNLKLFRDQSLRTLLAFPAGVGMVLRDQPTKVFDF